MAGSDSGKGKGKEIDLGLGDSRAGFNPTILRGLPCPAWMEHLRSIKPPFPICASHNIAKDIFCIDCNQLLCVNSECKEDECRKKHDMYKVRLIPRSGKLALLLEDFVSILEGGQMKKLETFVSSSKTEGQEFVYIAPFEEKRKRTSTPCLECGASMHKEVAFCSFGCLVRAIEKANLGLKANEDEEAAKVGEDEDAAEVDEDEGTNVKRGRQG